MSDDILKSFEDACIKVTTGPSYDRIKYLALRADNIQLLTLRAKFKPIAGESDILFFFTKQRLMMYLKK